LVVSLLCLPFVPLRQKGRVIFIFGPGMYFQTGQVIFVLEWPKGEFVSILALFCVWTKSLVCNDAVNMDSTFRVMSEDSAFESEEFQVPCQPSGRSTHPVRTPFCPLFHPSGRRIILSGHQTDKHHLSGRHASSVRTPTSYREVSEPACFVRTFQQHVRTPINS
jgi:hypothetical protein